MTSNEDVERLAQELSALATREAETMPSGWPDAHKLYSDSADTLRVLLRERDEALVQTDQTTISNLALAEEIIAAIREDAQKEGE
mgnify:CR=1 FL=1